MSRKRRPLEEIVPDGFLSTWGASTYEEAIEKAERAETTTPESELPKCPSCESQRVQSKPSDGTMASARDYDTSYVCTTCRNHFDTPVYDLDDEGDDEPADPFEWVDAADLEEPPLRRQLAELDDRRLAALVIYLYRPWSPTGPSYRDLGAILPYSSDWVGARVRAWKDGEYRTLVRDPRPRVSLAVDGGEVSAE
jgi:hypothetical protein